jgi:hypothetical protein
MMSIILVIVILVSDVVLSVISLYVIPLTDILLTAILLAIVMLKGIPLKCYPAQCLSVLMSFRQIVILIRFHSAHLMSLVLPKKVSLTGLIIDILFWCSCSVLSCNLSL